MKENEVFVSDLSTTVRIDDLLAITERSYIKTVGGSLNLLSNYFPRLSAKAALKLWGKTRLKKYTPRGVFQKIQATWLEGEHGKIAVYRFPSLNVNVKKRVLLVHGWEGQASDFYKLIPLLLEDGFEIVTFDAPAHGQSDGVYTNLFQFVETIESLVKTIGPVHFAVGHSMGGTALALAQHYSQQFKPEKIVTIGSPNQLDQMIEGYAKFLNLNEKIKKEMRLEIERLTSIPTKDISMEQLLVASNGEVMIVHDEHDNMVPIDRAHEIKNKFLEIEKAVNFVKTEKLGHVKLLRDHYVIGEISRFLRD